MKLFTSKQISELDKFTIENEPVSDINLMERAAAQVTRWLVKNFNQEQKMVFFAGSGNNGADALAVARQLAELGFICEVYTVDSGNKPSNSSVLNYERLVKQGKVYHKFIKSDNYFPEIGQTDIIIDALFGSGLNRRLEGLSAVTVQKINERKNTVVSIDIPSGLMTENNTANTKDNTVRADFTLTFQFPKISFLFAENEIFTGKWKVLPIGLHPEGIKQIQSDFFFLEKEDIQEIIHTRPKFAHKGTFGHALLIAGSSGKMGAAVLASKACLRAGTGLLTTHVPQTGYNIIQAAVPEALASIDKCNSEFPELDIFSAIGIGPGIDKQYNTQQAFYKLLEKVNMPLVIDADGLNILSENKEWLEKLPDNSILTPHLGEFQRLAGNSANSYERIVKQLLFAKQYKVVVVLKGAFTTIATPNGKLFFNSTGNQGMATAGSGDVLTGIILGLLAQKISPENAAKAGVFIHGLAGDMAASEKSEYALISSDIIDFMGKAFMSVMK
ncbi:MAG: NAD(P)H-hydrate dehydratase [Bacteroidales bacterium]|jgi:NAD(P)H-hydrate epimerase|nr:NAD(P)H-hydrate dehydratase [Bacteroidales bacterium]